MDGVRRYDIVVKFALPLDADLEAIRNLPVMDPDGHPVPLAQLAEIRIEEGPAQISREFGQRRLPSRPLKHRVSAAPARPTRRCPSLQRSSGVAAGSL